MTTILT